MRLSGKISFGQKFRTGKTSGQQKFRRFVCNLQNVALFFRNPFSYSLIWFIINSFTTQFKNAYQERVRALLIFCPSRLVAEIQSSLAGFLTDCSLAVKASELFCSTILMSWKLLPLSLSLHVYSCRDFPCCRFNLKVKIQLKYCSKSIFKIMYTYSFLVHPTFVKIVLVEEMKDHFKHAQNVRRKEILERKKCFRLPRLKQAHVLSLF